MKDVRAGGGSCSRKRRSGPRRVGGHEAIPAERGGAVWRRTLYGDEIGADERSAAPHAAERRTIEPQADPEGRPRELGIEISSRPAEVSPNGRATQGLPPLAPRFILETSTRSASGTALGGASAERQERTATRRQKSPSKGAKVAQRSRRQSWHSPNIARSRRLDQGIRGRDHIQSAHPMKDHPARSRCPR